MVKVWLWDVDGPGGSASGVAGDEAEAVRAAEAAMGRTGAAGAVVEAAWLGGGGLRMEAGYVRSGWVRSGRLGGDGLVSWSGPARAVAS